MAGWTVNRVAGRELFVSPEGLEYVRAAPGAAADLELTSWRTRGLPPLRLRRESGDRLVRVKERAARRLDRRTARLRR